MTSFPKCLQNQGVLSNECNRQGPGGIVLVHQTRGGQLGGEAMAEHLSKSSLMVIKQLLALIVDSSHVNDNVAGLQYGWIPCSLQVWQTIQLNPIGQEETDSSTLR